MAKVLFIGHHRENTDIGIISRKFIQTLEDMDGLQVVARSIFAPTVNTEIKAENRSLKKVTHIIYHTIPNFIDYNGYAKNIALLHLGSTGLGITGWQSKLNMMDEVWVVSDPAKKILENSGITVPIHVVPVPVVVKEYQQQYGTFSFKGICDNDFTFYCKNEWSANKDLSTVVKAFNLEFDPNEPVKLFFKTGIPSLNNNSLAEKHIIQKIQEIKSGLRLYKDPNMYAEETLLITPYNMIIENAIHKTMDCLVSTAKFENYALDVVDAHRLGNKVIAGRHLLDHLPTVTGDRIKSVLSYEEPIELPGIPANNINTARESWYQTSIPELRKAMREMYNRGKVPPFEKDRVSDATLQLEQEATENLIRERLC